MASQSLQAALEAIYADRLFIREGLIEVPTSVFVQSVDVGMSALPPFAFYVFKNGNPEVLKAEGQGYSPLALSKLDSVYIESKDLPHLRAYADSLLVTSSGSQGPGSSSSPSTQSKLESLRKSAIHVVDQLFTDPSPENINKSKKVVGSFVYLMMKDPQAYMLLAKLSSHDAYTLQHSVGAAVNAIILGRKLGIKDESELLELGLGGLLHDIGKVHVKKEIINKPGPLDEHEWEEMRQHSLAGFEIVRNNPDLTERTKRAILEHHEDKTGTGYPHRKSYDQVSIHSRIVCLCDIFNALTTNRSYSTARTPFEAFQLIREKMMTKVDDVAFKELVLIYGGKLSA